MQHTFEQNSFLKKTALKTSLSFLLLLFVFELKLNAQDTLFYHGTKREIVRIIFLSPTNVKFQRLPDSTIFENSTQDLEKVVFLGGRTVTIFSHDYSRPFKTVYTDDRKYHLIAFAFSDIIANLYTLSYEYRPANSHYGIRATASIGKTAFSQISSDLFSRYAYNEIYYFAPGKIFGISADCNYYFYKSSAIKPYIGLSTEYAQLILADYCSYTVNKVYIGYKDYKSEYKSISSAFGVCSQLSSHLVFSGNAAIGYVNVARRNYQYVTAATYSRYNDKVIYLRGNLSLGYKF